MGDVSTDNIKVVVRVRDLIGRESDQRKAFTTQDSTDIVQKETKKSWTFDRVYSPLDNNRAVYSDTASSIIEQTVSGFNTTIFAYGQTSSGKTHTMHGNPQEPGVIGMAVEQLFYAVEDTPDRRFLMQVSYMEIYNEMVNDLLSDPKTRPAAGLKVRESEEGFYVEGLSTKTVTSPEEIQRFMKIGEKSRNTAKTNMNEKSSRSHTIFRITLESTNRLNDADDTFDDAEEEGRQVTVSQLNLVDLAGSERAAQTGAGGIRLKEGCNINNSLMVLGQVIQKLSSGDKGHINFRDSNLTRILQNSIGGNAKTAIICTVTPAEMSVEQTISTLRFASQAKTIQNHATVNEVLDDQAQINRLKKDMAKLLKELEDQKKKDANTEMVQEMREQLERERMEKEEHLRKIKELQEKVITSSQPAPPRKSMMMMKKNNRRETWCGPAMRKNMRMSFAPQKFLKPLLPLDLPMLAENPFPSREETQGNLSLASVDFNLSRSVMESQLDDMEVRRLEELETLDATEEQQDVSVFEEDFPQRSRSRSVRFLSSPQFLSPRRPPGILTADLNSTDNGTPKAVIRDKYKRVSIALTSREVELDKERQARLDLEREHQELQEFTRLESESGVDDERRMSQASAGTDADLLDKLKYYEKSFTDIEKLNLDLRKELSESKQNGTKLHSEVQDLRTKLEEVVQKESEKATKLDELSPLVQEVKELRQKNVDLENHKKDFDMKLELEVDKKETSIKDLRKYLESAYEEIATLESGNKVDVRERFEKTRELEAKFVKIEVDMKTKERLLEELEAENEGLKEGMEVVTAEMVKLSEDKIVLEEELQSVKGKENIAEEDASLRAEIEELKATMKIKSDEISNLQLSNASLLETVDDLSRKLEESGSKNSELLVSSAELGQFNVELKEEMGQLKVEVKMLNEVKDQFEVENEELKASVEEVRASKSNLEELLKRSQNTEEIDALKEEVRRKEGENAKLEALLKNDERSIMISKLSATLNNIEESFIAVDDGNKTCQEESPGNSTIASAANTTFGVPLEVVEEMKNQLLCLQQQLINFSPEEFERKVAEIEELKLLNNNLNEELCKVVNEKLDDKNNAKKHLEETEEALKVKHRAEIAIISTKMQEEMNFNIPALEERIRVECEEKYEEGMRSARIKFEEDLRQRDDELKETKSTISNLQDELRKSREEMKSVADTMSSQENTTLGILPGRGVESLYTTAQEEISFDNTLGSGSMNMTMENTVFSAGIGDSLQVQMLKGEVEMLKNSLEEKEEVISELRMKEGQEVPVSAHELEDEETADLLRAALKEKELLIQELREKELRESSDTSESAHELKVQEDLENANLALKEKVSLIEEMKMRIIEIESERKAELEENEGRCQSRIAELQEQISQFENLKVQGEEYVEEILLKCQNSDAEKDERIRELEVKEAEYESTIENMEVQLSEFEVLREKGEEYVRELTTRCEELESNEENIETIKDELKSTLDKMETVEGELLEEKQKNRQLNEELENVMSDLESAIIEKENALENFSEHEEKVTELLEANAKHILDLDEQKLVVDKFSDELAEMKSRNVEIFKKSSQLALEKDNLSIDIKRLEEEKSGLEEKIVKMEDSASVINQERENEKKYYEKCLQDAKSDSTLVATISSKLAEMEAKYDNIISSKADLESEYLEMLENVKQEKSELEKRWNIKAAELSEIVELKDVEISKLGEEKVALANDLVALKTNLEKSSWEFKSTEESIAALELKLKAEVEESAKVKVQLNNKFDEIQNLKEEIESLIQSKADSEAALEAKLHVECEEKSHLKLSLELKTEEVIAAKEEKKVILQEQADSELAWQSKHLVQSEHEEELRRTIDELKRELEQKQTREVDFEKQVERLKFDVEEAERLRDIVDAECDKLESELEETKVKLIEVNTTHGGDRLSSLQSTMVAGQQTLLNNVSMDCTFIPAPDAGEKIMTLEREKEDLTRELSDVKRQLASSPTEEKYVNLKKQLIQQKEYSDKMFEENTELKRSVNNLQDNSSSEVIEGLNKKLSALKEELGKKNIEYASLKVDVDKGELEYKRKCEILQADLEYEKSNSTRLTQEIRRYQASAMDTTVIQPKTQAVKQAEVSSAACNTSVTTAASPVWSSGSGAIKEIRLHSAEMRVKTLEKENSRLKEHEEFYINKAREWKGRALKYERTLEQHSVTVPGKENRREADPGNSSAPAPALPVVDPATAKVYQAAGLSPRASINPLQDLQNLRQEPGPAPPTPTEDIKLVLSRRSQPRRTEEDFRLPEDKTRKKADDCKTQ